MIPTDGVKVAADDLAVLDSQSIADELNRLQSQKFIDPNCHPDGEISLDVSKDSFCADPPLNLDGRAARLAEFMKGMPILPTPIDQSVCAQAALTKIQELISKKFSFSNLETDTKKSNFAEEKFEAQLTLVSYVTSLVYSLAQVNRKIPNLIAATIGNASAAMVRLNNLVIDDNIASFERQHAVDRLKALIAKLNSTPEDKTVYDVRITPLPRFVTHQNNMLEEFTTPIVTKGYNDYLRLIDQKIIFSDRKPPEGFGDVYSRAGKKLQDSSSPSIDDYYTNIVDGKLAMFTNSYARMSAAAADGVIKEFAYSIKATADIEAAGFANTINSFLTQAYIDLTDFLTSYVKDTPKTPTEKDVLTEIGNIDFCGTKLPSSLPPEDGTPTTPNTADLAWNTFDIGNKPTLTDIKYWKRYSIYLTLVNLLPIFWTIGLYIPTPSGIVKVPLPTVWKPLIVINARPFGLIVIFLTINGIAISPTVWLLKYPPFGKNDSNMLVMLRAFNKKIKDDTGDALLNVPVVAGINVNPTLTKSLPFKQDDLPTIKRLGMNNPPYLLYLNQWLKQYKTGGGLP